mmetsp:Transcript_49260/g.127040  ORF Transcript_49260/g.127040 Transcript_49260/m.127040 type:complete len:88 (-) Transcript_49260:356-619(-)
MPNHGRPLPGSRPELEALQAPVQSSSWNSWGWPQLSTKPTGATAIFALLARARTGDVEVALALRIAGAEHVEECQRDADQIYQDWKE